MTLSCFVFLIYYMCLILGVSHLFFIFHSFISKYSKKMVGSTQSTRKTDCSQQDKSLQESKSKHLVLLPYLELRSHHFQGFSELRHIYWPLWRMNYFKIKSLLLPHKTSQAPCYYITISTSNILYFHQFRYLELRYFQVSQCRLHRVESCTFTSYFLSTKEAPLREFRPESGYFTEQTPERMVFRLPKFKRKS